MSIIGLTMTEEAPIPETEESETDFDRKLWGFIIVLIAWVILVGGTAQSGDNSRVYTTSYRAEVSTYVPVSANRVSLDCNSLTYTVEAGDTLYGIAAKFGIDPNVILQATNLTNPNLIQANENICITLPSTQILLNTP